MWYAKMYFSEDREIFQYDSLGTQGVPDVQEEFPFLESLLSFQEFDCTKVTPMLQSVTDNWSRFVAEDDKDALVNAMQQLGRLASMAKSNELIMTAILGGRGSITGTLIAGAVLIPLPEFLRFGSAQEWRMVLYGLLVVITIIFRPTGLVGGKEITPKAIRQFGMQMRQRLHRMNGVVRKGDGEHE